jgi:hypothetical protein
MPRLRNIGGHLRPRRLRLYGVGNAKSGTTSLAQMFGFYRAGHQVDGERMVGLATKVLLGELDVGSTRVRAALRRKSVRYHLEVDVAGHMTVFARPLADMYADAKFVLLIRDCFSWLNSSVEQRMRSDRINPAFFHARYARYGDEFMPDELVLREAAVVPIAGWLRSWTEMNQRVLDAVPSDRLLVVRTEDLDASVEVLARFAGVPASTVRAVPHANPNPAPTGVLSEVPAQFVIEQAREHCGPLMERFWGTDWYELAARLPQQRISGSAESALD